MLYDLNVPWSSTQDPLELERTISFLTELGYSTLALNHIITGPLPSQITNPIPQTVPFTILPKTRLLRRCTLAISDPSLNHRLPALSAAYDILALRPTTEKAFLAACNTISEHSLISLDLTVRFPFHFKPKPFMTAINRGIRFEICYAQATMEDNGGRRNFISNCLGILRATRGRGLVLSSEAKGVLGVRAPADVVNLMLVWGLGRDRGRDALDVAPRGVVVNEGLKRTSFRGIVDVIYGGEKKGEENDWERRGNATRANGTGAEKKGKRKIEEEDANGEATLTVSKRQAKRTRLEALKASKEVSSSVKEVMSREETLGKSEHFDTPSVIKATTNI